MKFLILGTRYENLDPRKEQAEVQLLFDLLKLHSLQEGLMRRKPKKGEVPELVTLSEKVFANKDGYMQRYDLTKEDIEWLTTIRIGH